MTLSQCKKLKVWGLPQKECRNWLTQDGSTWLGMADCDKHGVLREFHPDNGFGRVLLGCPDLEQLLEFAKTEVKSILRLQQSYANKDTWLACDDDNPSYAVDPDPKVAIFRLLEKVRGNI